MLWNHKIRSSHGISVVGDSLYMFGGKCHQTELKILNHIHPSYMIIDVNALQGSTQQEPQFQVIFMSWTWPHRSSSKPQPQLHNYNNFQPQCDVIFVALILIIQRWVVEEVKGSPPSPRFGHAQVFPVRNATHLPHLQLNVQFIPQATIGDCVYVFGGRASTTVPFDRTLNNIYP